METPFEVVLDATSAAWLFPATSNRKEFPMARLELMTFLLYHLLYHDDVRCDCFHSAWNEYFVGEFVGVREPPRRHRLSERRGSLRDVGSLALS